MFRRLLLFALADPLRSCGAHAYTDTARVFHVELGARAFAPWIRVDGFERGSPKPPSGAG